MTDDILKALDDADIVTVTCTSWQDARHKCWQFVSRSEGFTNYGVVAAREDGRFVAFAPPADEGARVVGL